MSAVYIDSAVLWARLLGRVVIDANGCWIFQGSVTSRGYGCVGSGKRGKNITTHRLAVLVRDGELADDMSVDHQCHDSAVCRKDADCQHRRCVNPSHLKVMPIAENVSRVWASDRCRKGHALTMRHDGKCRQCLTCRREYATAARAQNRKPDTA